jgi:hypothetical protein
MAVALISILSLAMESYSIFFSNDDTYHWKETLRSFDIAVNNQSLYEILIKPPLLVDCFGFVFRPPPVSSLLQDRKNPTKHK